MRDRRRRVQQSLLLPRQSGCSQQQPRCLSRRCLRPWAVCHRQAHRQAGRQPDPIQAVQPLYLDALPVEMTQTPSSTDLAQPDAPPALLRNSDGTVRAMPQTEADDLP